VRSLSLVVAKLIGKESRRTDGRKAFCRFPRRCCRGARANRDARRRHRRWGRTAVSSKQFVEELDEVKRLGGRDSRELTSDQTAVAVFWTAPSYVIFSSVARQVSDAKSLDLHENARLFALLNGATIDAYTLAGQSNTSIRKRDRSH
jgi:hypothetical protein